MGKIKVRRNDNTKIEYTEEGFLVDNPIVTRIGIFEYENPDGSIRRELRLPQYVFDQKSLQSYEGKPVILTHDAGRVTPDNVAGEIVGTMLSPGYVDGENVRVKIIIHDTDKVLESGFRELSLGYDAVLEETGGVYNGEPYDAIQTDIVINHLAIVDQARAGEQARLNIDSKNNNSPVENKEEDMGKSKKQRRIDKKAIANFNMRKKARLDADEEKEKQESEVVGEIKDNEVDPSDETKELSIEERVQEVIDRRDRRDAESDFEDIEEAKTIIAEQDEDIEKLIEIVEELQAQQDFSNADEEEKKEDEDENTEEKKEDEDEDTDEENKKEKILNEDSIDRIIAERIKLGRIGDRLKLDGLETLKPLDAKKKIIRAINPKIKLDGKSSHYINTAFDIAIQDLPAKNAKDQKAQIFNRDARAFETNRQSGAMNARDRMINRMMNGGNE